MDGALWELTVYQYMFIHSSVSMHVLYILPVDSHPKTIYLVAHHSWIMQLLDHICQFPQKKIDICQTAKVVACLWRIGNGANCMLYIDLGWHACRIKMCTLLFFFFFFLAQAITESTQWEDHIGPAEELQIWWWAADPPRTQLLIY